MVKRKLPINTERVRNIVDSFFEYSKFRRLKELEYEYYNVILNAFIVSLQSRLINGEEYPYLNVKLGDDNLTILLTDLDGYEYEITTSLIVLHDEDSDKYYIENSISILKHETMRGIGYLKTFGEIGIILKDYAKTHDFITEYATRIGLIVSERFSAIDDIETIMRKITKRILRKEQNEESSDKTLLKLRRLLSNLN